MYNEIQDYIRSAITTHTADKYTTLIYSATNNTISHNATEWYRANFNTPVTIMPYNFIVDLVHPMEEGNNLDATFRSEWEDTFITSDEIGVPACRGAIVTIDSHEVIIKLLSFIHGYDNGAYRSRIELEFAVILKPRYS